MSDAPREKPRLPGEPSRSPGEQLRAPKQARSRKTLERIVAVAGDLLEHKEFRDVTLREIADGAGVSLSSVYARFPTKEAILHHLHKEHNARMRDVVAELREGGVLPGKTLYESLYRMSAVYISEVRARPGFYRAFQLAQRDDALLREAHHQVGREAMQYVVGIVMDSGEVRHPQAGLAALVALGTLSTVLRTFVQTPEQYPDAPPIADDDLARELAAMAYAYLTNEPPEGPASFSLRA